MHLLGQFVEIFRALFDHADRGDAAILDRFESPSKCDQRIAVGLDRTVLSRFQAFLRNGERRRYDLGRFRALLSEQKSTDDAEQDHEYPSDHISGTEAVETLVLFFLVVADFLQLVRQLFGRQCDERFRLDDGFVIVERVAWAWHMILLQCVLRESVKVHRNPA